MPGRRTCGGVLRLPHFFVLVVDSGFFEDEGTGQKRPFQSARGLAQSKSWRPLEPAVNARSVLDCASPLALSDDHGG
jgi:hypothetical protein